MSTDGKQAYTALKYKETRKPRSSLNILAFYLEIKIQYDHADTLDENLLVTRRPAYVLALLVGMFLGRFRRLLATS